MKRVNIATLFIILSIVCGLVIPASVYGQTYVYMAENSDRQPPLGDTNPVFINWLSLSPFGGGTVRWYAPAGNIRNIVQNAVNDWENSSPSGLKFSKSTNEEYSDLKFIEGACPFVFIDHFGCFLQAGYAYSSPRDAYLWNNSAIYLNFQSGTGITWTNTKRRSVISHELGHAHGLEDRYANTNPPSCVAEATLMDGFNGDGSHCDGLTSPNSLDEDRVEAFWRGGDNEAWYSFQNIYLSGNKVVHEWKDHAWADWKGEVIVYWRVPNSPAWNIGGYTSFQEDIGIHHVMAPFTSNRTVGGEINPSNYGVPHGRGVVVCARPYYGSSLPTGHLYCSTEVYWP